MSETQTLQLRRIEELGFNAWPAKHTLLIDGWVVRLSDGYTKRANSVNPLYPGNDDGDPDALKAKIDTCIDLFARLERQPIFRLTSFAAPPGLDELLAARGFEFIDRTLVMTCPLKPELQSRQNLSIVAESLDDWLPRYSAFHAAPPESVERHRAILERIPARILYATTFDTNGAAVATGLGVLEHGYLGLFDIVTDPDRRREGHGRALLHGMLNWARGEGVHTAWLAVTATNTAAHAMYERAGFAEIYDYWYRVASPATR